MGTVTFHSISKEQWKSYHDNPAYPFLNRTIVAQPPGSPFKLVTALAACRTGNAADHHTCDGFVTYGNLRFGCWIWNAERGRHGDLSLHDASPVHATLISTSPRRRSAL